MIKGYTHARARLMYDSFGAWYIVNYKRTLQIIEGMMLQRRALYEIQSERAFSFLFLFFLSPLFFLTNLQLIISRDDISVATA